ncbi:MAG: hypothetical protein JKY15_01265, partial [Deltaproteobacteria bacterium]|nr:hypothetical protein [Deltaproteobacteria bacterium]
INFTNYLEILSTGFPENFAGVLVVYNNPAILMREVYWNTKGYVKKVKKLMVPYDWSFNNKENKIFMSPYEWSAATQKLTVSLSGICRFELWHKNGLRSSPRLDMRSGSPNEADFKIAALQTGSYLESQLDDNAPDLEKGFNQLSSKILLINELDLIDGMDTPDTLSKLYPFEYRIVSGPVMDSIILNHNIKYAALLLIPYPIIMKERTNQSDRSTTHNVGINLGYNTLALDLQDYRVLSQTKRTYKSDRIQALSLLALDPLTFKTKKKELLGMKGTVGMTSANEMALVGCALSGLLSVIALMYYFIF